MREHAFRSRQSLSEAAEPGGSSSFESSRSLFGNRQERKQNIWDLIR